MTAHPQTSPLGELDRSGEVPVLRYRRRFSQAPETVWQALTDDQHLKHWFPTTIEGELVPGATLTFAFPAPIEVPPMRGELVRHEPPRVLEFTWGPDRLRFELADADPGTELLFTVELEGIGKAARDGAGWHTCLDALELALAGRPDREVLSDRWRAVHPGYVERFGPDAATEGPPQEREDAHGTA
jgi:uncharacterized protein YndB with AHSA1/START domain